MDVPVQLECRSFPRRRAVVAKWYNMRSIQAVQNGCDSGLALMAYSFRIWLSTIVGASERTLRLISPTSQRGQAVEKIDPASNCGWLPKLAFSHLPLV